MARLILTIILISLAASLLAEPWGVNVFFNNDRHGSIAPAPATFMNPETPPPLGTFPSEVAVLKKQKQLAESRGEGFMYLDQGDIYQGAPVGSLTKGESTIIAYNAFPPDVVTVGNHEFDDGFTNFMKLVEMSEFTWLGANLIDNTTGKIIEGLEPFIIREFAMPNGKTLRVGVIGITTRDTKTMSFPENTGGISILDEAETATAYAETLRTKHDVDFVIASCHIGLPFDAAADYEKLMDVGAQFDEGHYSGMNLVEMASKVEGIDVIFGGHIHVGYHRPWEDPETHVLVFQNYAKGTGIGGVKFLFDQDSKVFLGYEPIALNDALATLFADEFWPDKDIAELVDSLQKDAEKGLAEVIAQATGALPRGDATSNKVGHIVCDAMLDATGADVSITNMGGVRSELPSGTITRADVFAVMPFDNKVVSMPLSGQEVVEVIERMAGKYGSALIGGVEVVYNSTKGNIHSLKIGGAPVDSSATYDFATTDYVYYSYGVPQLEAIDKSKVKFSGVLLRDAIERWLTNNSPVSPDVDGRWKYIEEE